MSDVYQLVRAGRLDDGHLGRRHSLVGRAQAHMLGAYAHMDLTFVMPQGYRNPPGAAVDHSPAPPRSPSPALQHVQAGIAHEARNEHLGGLPAALGGRSPHPPSPPPPNRPAPAHSHLPTPVPLAVHRPR